MTTTSRKFQASSPSFPCPICGRNDKGGDCRISNDLVLCHHGSTFSPPALAIGATTIDSDGREWAYTGETDDGRCAMFTPHKAKPGARRTITTVQAPSKPSQPVKLALLPEGADNVVTMGIPGVPSGVIYDYSPFHRVQRTKEKQFYSHHRSSTDAPYETGKGEVPWPLYNQDAVVRYGPDNWALEVEGERCCDVGTSLGMVAFSQPGNKALLSSVLLQQRYAYIHSAGLGGVVYIMDNDKEGESKGEACLAAATAAGLPMVALKAAEVWPGIPAKGSIDDLPEPLNRSETIATIEKAANEQWQKQSKEAGKKERAVRKITTKPAKEGESSSQSKRQRLAPDEVVALLPEKVGHLRLNSRNGEITAGDKILPPNTITRLYLELSDSEKQWPKETTIDAVAHLAAQDAFDPVAEYLVSIAAPALPQEQWERLDRHLLGIDDPIAAAFLPRYFISAVARTFEPGCDCRQLPVLIGPQWRGKSALGRILFGAEQWVEGIGDLGKDALMKAHTAWGVEMAELDGVTRRSDQESLKAFISETADTIRKPYDRSPERFPRSFVFWGTSNGAPLRDLTGNSRYVCIGLPDKLLPLEWATANRDAIWAKAVEQYEAGVQWRDCSEAERQAINERNEEHGQLDPWADMVSFFINNNKAGCEYVELKEVLEMLEVPIERQSNQTAKRVGELLNKMGWKRERRRLRGGGQLQAFWRPAPKHDESIPLDGYF